jgi:dipeptidyl-peptidase-4
MASQPPLFTRLPGPGSNRQPVGLKDGLFLWFSERSGWKHLYHYTAEGKLLHQVTDGKWEARSLAGVDETSGWVYFAGTEHSPIARRPYRVKLDGTWMTRLATSEGSHRVDFSPTFGYFTDVSSDLNTPSQLRLYRADGKLVRVIEENRVNALTQYKLGKSELLQVKTRDGFAMEAMMIKPPDFDATKKYPVLEFTYSGPHAPQVRNAWGGPAYMWHRFPDGQERYIIGFVTIGRPAAKVEALRGKQIWAIGNCATRRWVGMA